eukprot:CAMPEP_0172796228 /NCGR_PEP_ID=MMETSP1074-20121228/210884_1 /TAXON_ID=2916 /ORGANISM="Ceratium fusus, Strain PA161109" /LENGTH=56 /DNA_ID=CAMNT_0013633321 /DNA_START=85 /DNA_END=255 /DNA_ORIENTATION=-
MASTASPSFANSGARISSSPQYTSDSVLMFHFRGRLWQLSRSGPTAPPSSYFSLSL